MRCKELESMNWTEVLYKYDQAVKELTVKFETIMNDYRRLGMYSPIDSVDGRVKKVTSIMEKVIRKNIPTSDIENSLEDIAGIRLLCQFVEDIYKVVEMIHERDGKDMFIVEERDYIKNKKPSGYRSYHIIIRYPLITAKGYSEVLAEIQIRTLAMNFWATAEHSLKYKYRDNVPEYLQQRLINCANVAFQLDEEMAKIRKEITAAQRLNEMRNNLVANITENMQSLYFLVNKETFDRLNNKFMKLCDEGIYMNLKRFNNEILMIKNNIDNTREV